MADPEQLRILKEEGVEAWNAWRKQAGWIIFTDLSEADLNGANLSRAKLRGANLSRAKLRGANLSTANLSGANLNGARLNGTSLIGADLRDANLIAADLRWATLRWAILFKADLGGANLSGANLSEGYLSWANFSEANLSEANLSWANLSHADLPGANLSGANFNNADLGEADLTGCRIYGVSAWGLKLGEGTKQQGLIVTPKNEPEITTDDIEVAQFLYLLIRNEKLRKVIDTITSKVVLILGRFTPERKVVLDALRDEVRKRNYLPVVFDFEKSASRTTDETVTLLARMARFVIADLSDAKSVLQELRGVVPDLPSVPVQPLILASQDEPGMFDFFHRFPWVLTTYQYATQENLLANLDACVVTPAEAKVRELQGPQRPAPDAA
jgi:uncharacterized protein YjbI with pentapeptide repeats